MIEAQDELAGDGKLVPDVTRGFGAPAREGAARSWQAPDQPPERVWVGHRAPGRGYRVVEAVETHPELLEVEAFVS